MSTELIDTQESADATWWERVNKTDLVITSLLLALFVMAFVIATGWKALAAYFPLGVSGIGAGTSAIFLIRVLFFPRKKDAPKTNVPDGAQSSSDQEYEFFKQLTTRDWVVSLGWLTAFYVLLGIAGIYVVIVVFTVGYLRYQVEKSWSFATVYAFVLLAVVAGVFKFALKLPLPGGLLGIA